LSSSTAYLAPRKYVFTKTALILHDDLPSIFVLCSAVQHRCFAAIPAHTVLEAHSLIAELHATVDLLIVSDEVPDALAFTLELEATNPELIIIEIFANRPEEVTSPSVKTSAVLQNPDASQSARYWIEALGKALRQSFE